MTGKENLNIVAICGSLRKESFNKKVLKTIEKESDGKWTVLHADIGKLPLFNEDIEGIGDPKEVKEFKDMIREADGVLIVTPEYNMGMPGVLKNALDWGSRPAKSSVFNQMPVALAGATPGGMGTALSQMQIRQTLAAMNANVMSGPKLLISEIHKKINQDTQKLEDPKTLSYLKFFIDGFSHYVEMYKREKR